MAGPFFWIPCPMAAPVGSTPRPAAPRTIVYIDGFNLYYGALKGGPHKWLDLERYFTLLRPHDDISQLHYFTALVRGPTLANQQTYLCALATLPLVNVVLGNYTEARAFSGAHPGRCRRLHLQTRYLVRPIARAWA